MARKTKGRRKVEMKKMENEANLQVTFSKRRNGLFKKASEITTMCGAEAAVIVFSPGGKVFSFGDPSVEEVADRFLTGQVRHRTGASQLVEAYRTRTVRGMNQELTMVTDQVELEKKRGEELRRRIIASRAEYGLEKPVEELDDMAQLERLKASLEQLRINVSKEAENLLAAQQKANLEAAASQFKLGTGSSSTSGFGQVGGSANNVGFTEKNVGFTGGSENNNATGFMPFNAWSPGYGGPGYGDPTYGGPSYGGPGYGGPGHGGPGYGGPF